MKRRQFLLGVAALAGGCAPTKDQWQLWHEQAVVDSLQPGQDKALTIGFEILNAQRPDLDLNELRRTVGLAEFGDKKGTTVLLDSSGRLELCAHQIFDRKYKLTFSPPQSSPCETSATVYRLNKRQDMAFAVMDDPSLIQKFNLRPVDWENAEYEINKSGEEIIIIGYPLDSYPKMHATLVTRKDFKPFDTFPDEVPPRTDCLVGVAGTAYFGDSGAAVYCGKRFAGPFSAARGTYSLDGDGDFSPAAELRAAYEGVFPDRIQAIRTRTSIDMPSVCRFDKTDFKSFVEPHP